MDYAMVLDVVKMILDNEYDNGHIDRTYSREDVALMVESCEYELGEDYIDEDDGQPSWEQEWEDFGEVYDDDPMRV